MHVRNVGNTMVLVCDRSLAPHRSAEIDDDALQDWLDRSGSNREVAATLLVFTPSLSHTPHSQMDVPPPPESLTNELVRVISNLNPGDSSLWRSDGVPTVAALQPYTSNHITGKDRDDAWKAYQSVFDREESKSSNEG